MSTKTTTFVFLAFIAILGWNAFHVKGDDATPKEMYCKQQAGWHPDCNVE